MKKTLIAAGVTILLVELFALFQAKSSSGFDGAMFGVTTIFSCIATLFLGVILLFIPKAKPIGEGILLATALLLLIGLSVCGNYSFR